MWAGSGTTIALRAREGGTLKSNLRALDVPALRDRLTAFEDQYGVPSERLYEVFTVNGVLRETPDFEEWSFLYGTLQDVVAADCSA